MAKKRKATDSLRVPSHLSARSRALWAELVPRRAESPERLALLQTALEALDRADQARVVVKKEGLTKTTERSGAVHLHPLLKVEADSRRQFARIWAELNLDWDHELDGDLFGTSE
ncbi:MAG: hypothetical protein L0Y72_23595 [Gemmataceae bacterium]|nr:hypothetical protein [Gemmataceae bacterium]MCI0742029.1 hypothetical protein [Gemmataceae bacterium]